MQSSKFSKAAVCLLSRPTLVFDCSVWCLSRFVYSQVVLVSDAVDKLYSLIVFSIIPNLKQIGFRLYWHVTMSNVYFLKWRQQTSLPWILLAQKINKWHKLQINQQVLATYLILKFARIWTCKFLICYATRTLNEGQGHPNSYQNVELSGFYHHTKFERNRQVRKNSWTVCM